MKVVLFCGGLGLRIRDAEDAHGEYRPILWHLMNFIPHLHFPFGNSYACL
jgi:glucose-1-phosphate cytidylyltransferase